jgi:7-cyano-7-deazaguanine synthase in queuosine biosynthesis
MAALRFFGNPSSAKAQAAMTAGLIGMTVTPKQGNKIPPGAEFIFDNSCFAGGYPGNDAFIRLLEHYRPVQDRCLFVVAPDVAPAGPMVESLRRSRPMLQRIREAGYRAALALQNGCEDVALPWGEFDVVFIGGDTTWKLGPAARRIAREARLRGKLVHMGRVNTLRRLRIAQEFCDTADGTCLTRGPDVNLPLLLRWLASVNVRIPLYDDGDEYDGLERPAVVLLSGASSATVLAVARADGFTPYALSLDYGQRLDYGQQGAEAVRDIAADLGAAWHGVTRFSMPGFGKASEAARHNVLLSFALACAEAHGAGDIFTGANAIDHGTRPDCRPEYIRAFELTASLASRSAAEGRLSLRVHTPLAGLTREQITELGLALGVDYPVTDYREPVVHHTFHGYGSH